MGLTPLEGLIIDSRCGDLDPAIVFYLMDVKNLDSRQINALVQGGKEVLADPFRKDALEMPSRNLEKYAHLNAN